MPDASLTYWPHNKWHLVEHEFIQCHIMGLLSKWKLSFNNDCQKFMSIPCFLWFTGSGAKVSRNCVLLHIPLESPDLLEVLSKNGFNGNRLSLWVLQVVSLTWTCNVSNFKFISLPVYLTLSKKAYLKKWIYKCFDWTWARYSSSVMLYVIFRCSLSAVTNNMKASKQFMS